MTLIQRIAHSEKYFVWIGIYAALGLLSTEFSLAPVVAFYVLYGTAFLDILYKRSVNESLDFMIAQLISWEVIGRMSNSSPWLPWETGKYALFILLVFGLTFKRGKSSVIGSLIILLSIPSIFLIEGDRIFKDLIFNYLGIVLVGLSIMYFYQRQYTYQDFKRICRVMMYPIISILAFITIKTPEFEQLQFELGANFRTTGGFGSNQVSTILGLGMLILGMFQVKRDNLFGNRGIDLILLAYIAFRALISLSRGGVFGAFGALGLAFLFFGISNKLDTLAYGKEVRNQKVISLFKLGMIGIGLFIVVNVFTDNILYLRYTGETEGTLAGVKEKDVNTITTGRLDVLISDIQIWSDNLVFGAGVGNSKKIRGEENLAVNAHVEFSRLLSEHGIFGALINVILLTYPFIIVNHKRFRYNKFIATSFLILALFTSLHSAMRTIATPMLYGLALIFVVPNEEEEQNSVLKPVEKEET